MPLKSINFFKTKTHVDLKADKAYEQKEQVGSSGAASALADSSKAKKPVIQTETSPNPHK